MKNKQYMTFDDEEQLIELVSKLPTNWGGLDGHLFASKNMKDAKHVVGNVVALYDRELLNSQGLKCTTCFERGNLFFEHLFVEEYEVPWQEKNWGHSKSIHGIDDVKKGHAIPMSICFNSCGAGDYAAKILSGGEAHRQEAWRNAKMLLTRALANGYKGYFIMGTVKDERDWLLPHDKEIPYAGDLIVSQFDNTALLRYNKEHGGNVSHIAPVFSTMKEIGFLFK